ncbi:hypothetical protein PS1_032819 [Malus domestica]
MCQDDLLHIFSFLPRELNFLEHTSNIGWKENQRARPVIIVPGLYHSMKSGVYWARERRSIPASFKLYMGSTWVVLTKSFLEFCVWGGTIFPVLSSCTTPISCHPQSATSTLLPAAIRTTRTQA